MREAFKKIFEEFRLARAQPFAQHAIASFIRNDLKKSLKDIVNDDDRYLIHASPGQGGWTDNPWIAIFDVFITKSAQTGFYPVFIFRDDMLGVYLTLNQGVTKIRVEYKKRTRTALRINSAEFRAKITLPLQNFSLLEINLANLLTTKSDLPRDYEAGNIVAKYYPADQFPSNEVLKNDIDEILKIYKSIIFTESSISEEEFDDESNFKGNEKKQYRHHRRIERNQTLINKVKKAQGFECKACQLNFVDKYGDLGKDYIEAHHLKAISKLTEEITELDARTDFVVLCSNCHRMIHRSIDPSDITAFKLHLAKYLKLPN